MDRGPQQTLNTSNLWLNVNITHSKFISSPFICLFSIIISIICPSFAPLYRDDIVVSTVERNVCDKPVRFLYLQVKVEIYR